MTAFLDHGRTFQGVWTLNQLLVCHIKTCPSEDGSKTNVLQVLPVAPSVLTPLLFPAADRRAGGGTGRWAVVGSSSGEGQLECGTGGSKLKRLSQLRVRLQTFLDICTEEL